LWLKSRRAGTSLANCVRVAEAVHRQSIGLSIRHIDRIALMFVWALFWVALQETYGCINQSRKFTRNLNSATHSVLSILWCSCAIHGYVTLNTVFACSAGYFLQDLRNEHMRSVYTAHHIGSVIALTYLFTSDWMTVLVGFMMCEISNLPLYLVYGMRHHSNTTALQFPLLVAMWFELIAYTICRGLMPLWIYQHITHSGLYWFATALHFVSLAWIRGIWRSIRAVRK
jgi:hypothetical protein